MIIIRKSIKYICSIKSKHMKNIITIYLLTKDIWLKWCICIICSTGIYNMGNTSVRLITELQCLFDFHLHCDLALHKEGFVGLVLNSTCCP